ncbi:DUF2851 family protein [Zunongwangia atlantica]|uniref:DUF2851 domain-containing protein n=1 Tax=Zunongwangia atlantica 22II14-10F7 TaxID=1185767 RepID=A0A1Y1T8T6_9FLAO|nr:DUF2851 family protein [Zunongwangia atlantica]ORL47469.1 hypothetical protein IIF7_01870 [Zunongwangia atlantica 22II14-10F7]
MREEFLHYIWQFQKFNKTELKTAAGESLEIFHPGTYNIDSGPDFFAAKLKIGDQLWAGNVEIHLKSSDWYAHHHETDSAYDNVILHVVWEHDVEVFRKDESVIASLELKEKINPEIQQNYLQLFSQSKEWINCEKFFPNFNDFDIESWLTRLYFERLEEKTNLIFDLLKQSNNDWEAVLFKLMAKNFGLNKNGDAFLELARAIDFEIIRKLSQNQFQLEAVLLGHAGLLADDFEDTYFKSLKSEYHYLKKKFKLGEPIAVKPLFFRLRPDNFPTIRLAQLAAIFAKSTSVFSGLSKAKSKKEIYQFFNVEVSNYWQTHYNFRSKHNPKPKRLSKSFIDLLIINSIVPLQYAFAKSQHREEETYLDLISEVGLESNSIVENFQKLKPKLFTNAMHSQSLLQLKYSYCDVNRCLKCALGAKFIKGKY